MGAVVLGNPVLVGAQQPAQQATAAVVLMPTGESDATGVAHVTISDADNDPNDRFFVSRIEINGLSRGPHATHIHEGFCPPPVGPTPDAQGPIVLDLDDTRQRRHFLTGNDTVTILTAGDLPTRRGGITSFSELLEATRNFSPLT